MAEERMPVLEALRKGEEAAEDPLREIVRWTIQELMEAEVAAQIGAGRYERSGERSHPAQRVPHAAVGHAGGQPGAADSEAAAGSYFPSWLEPRRRAEQALVAVVAEAYVQGVSTRKVEALVQALGISGISRSEVSRMAASLDAAGGAPFGTRRLDAAYPYLWVDARYEHVREGGPRGVDGGGGRLRRAGGRRARSAGPGRGPERRRGVLAELLPESGRARDCAGCSS